MSEKKDPLAVMADAVLLTEVGGHLNSYRDLIEARAAVAELVEAAKRAANNCDTGGGNGYVEIPNAYCSIPGATEPCATCGDLRAALAKFEVKP